MEILDRPSSHEIAHRISDDGQWSGASDTVNLRDVLVKFWVRKRLILTATLICALLAFAIAKLMTPTYSSAAFVMIKPQPPGAPGNEANVRGVIEGGPEAVQSEAFVLQSQALASAVIERLHLDRDPEFDPSLRKPNPLLALLDPVTVQFDKVLGLLQAATGWRSGAADAPAASDEVLAMAEADKSAAAGKPSTVVVHNFLLRLHVTVQQLSNVIQVSFSSSRPMIAALVPNTLIQLYLERREIEQEKVLAQESERLDTVVLPSLREKLRASEVALADYRQKSGLVGDPNQTVLWQQLSETKAQLAIAHAHTAEAAVRLSQLQPAPTAGTVVSDESPTLQVLREQEVELQAQLAALRSSLGENNPKTQAVAAQLKGLRDGLKREGAGAVGRLKAELAAAQATEAALTKRVAEFMHEFAQVNGGDTQLQRLIGEADADRKTYEAYLARSNEIRSNLGHTQPDASLVSRADVPLKPSFPTILIVVIGATIGAGAGLVLAGMLDTLLGGLRNKEQVEESLGLKCLGLVPRLGRWSRGRRPPPLLAPQNVAFQQAIRNVELKLLSFNGRSNSQVVLVTAALPAEGKTWFAVSLAESFAADGFSVVLVDCDLYRPTVHRMLDGMPGPGLSDYFAGGVKLDEIVQHDSRSGIAYISSGATLSNESRRITSDRLFPLIDRLREKYAFIILDSAPILAVPETMLLAQVAQKVILVVKWGSTPPAIARHAAMQLLEAGGAETAVLLSMVDAKRAAKSGDVVAGAYKQLGKYYGLN
jgi:polysaccharide biosynthesis transport protein